VLYRRPKGSRSKLSETFLKALADDFASNGIEVIEKVRNDRPHEYLKIVAAVLPKQMQLEDLTPNRKAEDLTDDELATIALSGPDTKAIGIGVCATTLPATPTCLTFPCQRTARQRQGGHSELEVSTRASVLEQASPAFVQISVWPTTCSVREKTPTARQSDRSVGIGTSMTSQLVSNQVPSES
jgi:hypothetical protein